MAIINRIPWDQQRECVATALAEGDWDPDESHSWEKWKELDKETTE